MAGEPGYFCRSFMDADLQSNVAVPGLQQAEKELLRMIAAGATSAHAIQHGKPDHEPELMAFPSRSANGERRRGELWRYLYAREGQEFKRWLDAYQSPGRTLDERWVVLSLSAAGIQEYGATGKAMLLSEGT